MTPTCTMRASFLLRLSGRAPARDDLNQVRRRNQNPGNEGWSKSEVFAPAFCSRSGGPSKVRSGVGAQGWDLTIASVVGSDVRAMGRRESRRQLQRHHRSERERSLVMLWAWSAQCRAESRATLTLAGCWRTSSGCRRECVRLDLPHLGRSCQLCITTLTMQDLPLL